MPRVWRPKFSRWRKQACAIWGMLGSLSAQLMSAVEPQDRLSSSPGTLPAIRSPGDIRLSQDPLWTHIRSTYHVLSAGQSIILPIKVQWLLHLPAGLTLRNSTFFPQNGFVCFEWISQRTEIISLYSSNKLVFIMEAGSVYCAVRPDSLNKFRVNLPFQDL